MEQDIFDKLLEQVDFEWVTARYPTNKKLSTKEGHAKKHLIDQIDEQQKWKKYQNINITESFESLVDTYEKISIKNIKENKYDVSKRYFDKFNYSLNITDQFGLETCLKNSRSKNKLVIVTCFYRNKIRDFIKEYHEKIPVNKLATTNYMTLNNLSYDEEPHQEHNNIDLKKVTEEFYESLKYNKPKEIKEMIESYKNELEYNTSLLEDYIKELINNLDKNINYIKESINNLFPIEEYQEQEYMEYYEKTKNGLFEDLEKIDFIEDLKQFKEQERLKKLKDEFMKKIDYYELLDMITDLMIYYIYIRLSKKYNLLKDYENKIYFIRQLNTSYNSLNDNINKFEFLVRHKTMINNTLYVEGIMFKNYKTPEEIIKEKNNLKDIEFEEIKNNIKRIDQEYNSIGSTEVIKCNNCNKLSYLHECPERNIITYEHNHKKIEKFMCPHCKNQNIKKIITSLDIYKVN